MRTVLSALSTKLCRFVVYNSLHGHAIVVTEQQLSACVLIAGAACAYTLYNSWQLIATVMHQQH
jgi:hypothetical protein